MKRVGLFLLALTLFVGAYAEKEINMDSLKQEIVSNSKEIHEMQKDSVMFSKLTPNQILDLKKQEMEIQKQRIENEGRSDMPFTGFQLFLICLLPFLFVFAIIIINSREKKEESKRRYDLYTKSLEMGQNIPENFFEQPKKSDNTSNFKRGILWLAVGVAVVISFLVIGKNNGLFLGIVPSFVGIGYLLVHYLDKPKTDSTLKDEQHG